MNLDPEQLPRHLGRQLAPLYVVFGDEPLLVLEAADRIRAAAARQGHTERELLMVESGFEWRRLWATGASLSLFATRRLVELRIPGSPGVEGGEALITYAADLPPDTITLISLAKIDRRGRETRWFKALDEAGVVIQAERVTADRLPRWLIGRLEQQGQQADAATLAFITARVEGNLLAAHQEVQKLALLFPEGPLDFQAVRNAVLDVARYDVFDLGPAVLAGDVVRVSRMLDGLQAEGVGPPLVLWALAEEARALLAVGRATRGGKSVQQACRELRVWGERQNLLPQALKRIDAATARRALAQAVRTDRVAKGVARGDVWDELKGLGLLLAGADPGVRTP